jgi:hypothetical protein
MEVLDTFDQPVPATGTTAATLRELESPNTCME